MKSFTQVMDCYGRYWYCSVVSNMFFIFHNVWDVILPIDELIFFKMV